MRPACPTPARRLTWLLLVLAAGPLAAQTPAPGEVRQIVSFRLLPGASAEVTALYRDRARPLYLDDEARLSVRVFREVESSIPLDLVVVSAFDGMEGMDRSNDALRGLATERGTDMGAIYGDISARAVSHTDEFVEMLPALGGGDPSSSRLTAFVRYRLVPGASESFETALVRISAWERDVEIPSATGRFLLSDGWDYLRVVGFDSLGDYQAYLQELRLARGYDQLVSSTVLRQEILLAAVRNLDVR